MLDRMARIRKLSLLLDKLRPRVPAASTFWQVFASRLLTFCWRSGKWPPTSACRRERSMRSAIRGTSRTFEW